MAQNAKIVNTKMNVFEKLPTKLVQNLMAFQKQGVEFAIEKHGRCLIADEMGLGKTLQAIAVAYYYRQEWPLLIIVPSSLKYSWIEEFEKWLPDVNPNEINLIQTGSDVSEIGRAQVTIAPFGLLSKASSSVLREALLNQSFQVVIVDESHYIRNIKTVSAKTVVPLIKHANRRILLSGTPALARPVELFTQIDALCPKLLGSWWDFTARYCDAKIEWIGKIRKRNVNGASNLEELQQTLSTNIMIRREKSQVLTQLPPKLRQKVLFELKDSDCKKEIRATFHELRPQLKCPQQDSDFEVLTGGGEDAKNISVLSLIQKLYRLSGEAKIGPAKEYIEMLCDNPKLKFLVFAYHHAMMNGLCESLHDKNVKFIRIDGKTPTSERLRLVHQFQSDADTRVAVLSILAASVGLTFTAATVVVFAEMYWTPGTMVQCEDRAHRIGQVNSVTIHYLVAKDTMDEWVWSAVCKKTIVTSTTLTGQKRKLEACAGESYQVEVLSNADVWIPSQHNDLDLSSYFQSQQDRDQKSILDFFSPSRTAVKNVLETPKSSNNSKQRVTQSSEYTKQDCHKTPSSKRFKLDLHCANENKNQDVKSCAGKEVIIDQLANEARIIINSDESDFEDTSLKSSGKRTKLLTSNTKMKKNKKLKSSKCNLLTAFKNIEKSPSDITFSAEQSKCDKIVSLAHGALTDHWNCSACTFLNHLALTNCEMCGTPKEMQKQLLSKEESNAVQLVGKSNCLIKLETNRKQHGSKRILIMSDEVNMNSHNAIKLNENHIKLENTKSIMPSSDIEDAISIDSENDHSIDDSLDSNANVTEVKSGSNTEISEDDEICQSDSICVKGDCVLEDSCFSGSSGAFHKEIINTSVCCQKNGLKPEDCVLTRVKDKNVDSLSEFLCNKNEMATSNKSVNVNNQRTLVDTENTLMKTYKEGNVKEDNVISHGKPESTQSSTKQYKFRSRKKCEHLDNNNKQDGLVKSVNDSYITDKNSSVVIGDVEENVCASPLANRSDECLLSSPYTELHDQGNKFCNKQRSVEQDSPLVNCDVPIYSGFQYLCSKYTSRIFLLTPDNRPLNVNFLPTDVEVGNDEALPDVFLQPINAKHLQRFVREWQSLSETKRRLITKTGQSFVSPLQRYEELRSCQSVNIQRHKTKLDTKTAAQKKAKDINGSLRIISKNAGILDAAEDNKGVAQVVAQDGTPLCLQCFSPYENNLLQRATITKEKNAWHTRFCSQKCCQEYRMVTNSEYCRDKLFEVEHGVCQICNLDTHALFRQIRDVQDEMKRAELIARSPLNNLSVNLKQQIVKKPTAGQFWHADHIKPVWEGGGQCDIDNLRTLCVKCHQKITAKQSSQRAVVRKLSGTVKSADITTFFPKILPIYNAK